MYNPNPARPAPQTGASAQQRAVQGVRSVAQGAAAYNRQKQAVVGEAGRFGRSMLGPFARAGKALWLEVTGVFYAIFALFFANYAWRLRGVLRATAPNPVDRQHFLAGVAAAVVFLYFTLTSFVRARRIQRRRA